MEKIEFRPTKILLVFWILGAALACIPFGGIAASIVVETGGSMHKAMLTGYSIPLAVILTYLILFFQSIRYELDGRYLTKASGILWKQRRSIPLGKITNIDVRQGPFERLFGYGKIWIFTPSTGAMIPEAKLVGIMRPQDMKQMIITQTEALRSSPAATHDASPASSGEVVALLSEICKSLKNIENALAQQK